MNNKVLFYVIIFINNSKTHKTKYNIIITFRLKQKDPYLLNYIKKQIGGNVYQFNDGMFSYSSTSFKIAYNVSNYFDTYHLQSSKHINYLKWRKAYIMVQEKKHLTETGIDNIIKLKNSMNRNSV